MNAPVSPLTTRARWVLRIALIIAWASGVAGTVTSCALLAHYRGPIPHRTATVASASSMPSSSESTASSVSSSAMPPVSASAPSATPAPASKTLGLTEAEADVMIEAFERFRRTKLPLTAANFVLSIALVIGAARTIGRRQGGRAWLQQVCLATALFATVEYVTSREERTYLVEKIPVVRANRLDHPGVTREQLEATMRGSVRLTYLLKLLAQLALYGGLAIALGRRAVELELATEGGPRPSVPPPSSSDDGES